MRKKNEIGKIILVSLVHNRKSLVEQALQSAANQTLLKDKWRYLILDNASTDGADKVCDEFSKKYPNIHFVRMSRNLGQMPAYNWILNEWIPNKCRDAEIMVHLDSDDLLADCALHEVSKKFSTNKSIGQIYSDFSIISSGGGIKVEKHPKAKRVNPEIELTEQGQKILRKMELKLNVIGHIRAMRISALNDIGGFDESYKYSTDTNMSCRMLSSKYKVAKIPKVLYFWREHGKQQIQGSNAKDQIKCLQKIIIKYKRKWKAAGLI